MRGDKDFRKEVTRLFERGVPLVEPKQGSTPSGSFAHDNFIIRRPSKRSESQVRDLIVKSDHVALVVENRYEEFVLKTQDQEIELAEEIAGKVVGLNMADMKSTIAVLKSVK